MPCSNLSGLEHFALPFEAAWVADKKCDRAPRKFHNRPYTDRVRSVRIASLLSLLAFVFLAAGCGNGDLNKDANAEKTKEEGAVDKRADAVGKLSEQAQSPTSSGQ